MQKALIVLLLLFAAGCAGGGVGQPPQNIQAAATKLPFTQTFCSLDPEGSKITLNWSTRIIMTGEVASEFHVVETPDAIGFVSPFAVAVPKASWFDTPHKNPNYIWHLGGKTFLISPVNRGDDVWWIIQSKSEISDLGKNDSLSTILYSKNFGIAAMKFVFRDEVLEGVVCSPS
jgi:hypothetical protein